MNGRAIRPPRPLSPPGKIAPPGNDGPRPTDVLAASFACGVAFLGAAAIAAIIQAIDPWPWGRWLAFHLAFVGGVSQLVLGASQFFVTAFLATDPPPRWLLRLQLAAWNAGTVLLVLAVTSGTGWLRWVAVVLLAVALGGWLLAIRLIRRRALRSFSWAARWYLAASGFLGLGVLAGALLAGGHHWFGGNLLAAHLALNLCGWFGASIVGTLHTFYPSLTGTQLGFPRLQGPAFTLWASGVAALALGYAGPLEPLATLGWLALTAASALLCANLVESRRRATIALSLPARLVGAAQPFLLAGTALALVIAVLDGPGEVLAGDWRRAAATLFVFGWIGLTVAGSLLHLLAVAIRVRQGFTASLPAPRPVRDRLLTATAQVAIAALAIGQATSSPALVSVATVPAVAVYAVFAAQTFRRAGRMIGLP